MAIGNQQTTSICLINQKGGCGKSSTCFHLAGAFAALGQRVLLVDVDPQGSISQAFFGSDAVERMPASETVAALFDDGCTHIDAQQLIRETHIDGISVLPANQHLAQFNNPNPERGGVMQFALREFLEPLESFDIILFDCPPNLYQCSWNAMIATQYVLIPIPPEDFGTQGIPAVHQAVTNARVLNPSLRRLGHLITRSHTRMIVHQTYEERLRQLYGDLVLRSTIPELSAFKVALACRNPVQMHAPRSKAAVRTRELVEEITTRVQSRSQQKEAA